MCPNEFAKCNRKKHIKRKKNDKKRALDKWEQRKFDLLVKNKRQKGPRTMKKLTRKDMFYDSIGLLYEFC